MLLLGRDPVIDSPQLKFVLVFEISELLPDLVDLLLVHVQLLLVLPLEALVRFVQLLALLRQLLVLKLQLVQLALHRLYVELQLLFYADVLPNIALQVLYDLFILLRRALSRGHIGACRFRNVLLMVYHDVSRAHAVHGAADLRGTMASTATVDVVVVVRPRLVLVAAPFLLARPVNVSLL